MARTVNERSPLYMTVAFTDENGDPLVPSSVEWRLDDLELETTIVDWTNLPAPSSTMSVVIGATKNTIVDEDNVREERMFGVRVDNGLDTEAHAEYKYHVINLRGPLG